MRAICVAPRGAFGKSLWFAAVSAGALPLWLLLARPIVGTDRAICVYFVLAAAAYLATIAPVRRRALGAAAAATAAGGVAALLIRAPSDLVLVLGVLIAVARSGFLYRGAPARSVAIEAIVAGGGLVFARFLFGPAVTALVLALWGFFLVQSLYFLLGERHVPAAERHPDPFQDAYGRALALLDRGEEGARLT